MALRALGRGRDDDCPPPPAQTRARASNAHGSHLGERHARPVPGPHALPTYWSCRYCLARCPASAQYSRISLADRLPSMRSADGSPPLFAHFAGTMQSLDSPPPCMEDLWLIAFSSRPAYFHGRRRGLPVLAHGVSLHAWGLRLRGAAPRSRYRECALLPSVRADAVGSPEPLISELNTQPTDTPWAKPPSRAVCRNKRLPPLGKATVQGSMPKQKVTSLSKASSATLPSPSHGSGPEWLATPSLYDSFIRYSMPVYPGAIQPKRADPTSTAAGYQPASA